MPTRPWPTGSPSKANTRKKWSSTCVRPSSDEEVMRTASSVVAMRGSSTLATVVWKFGVV